MNATKLSLCAVACFGLSALEKSSAASVTVSFFNPTGATALQDNSIDLAIGSLIEIGHFSTSTANFQGMWASIASGTVGSGAGNGAGFAEFSVIVDNAENLGIPAGDQLGVRFYNAASVASSSRFNTVTDSTWTFPSLGGGGAPPSINIAPADTGSVSDGSPEWQGGPTSAFSTTLTAVPEPSSAALLGLGMGVLLLRRRK